MGEQAEAPPVLDEEELLAQGSALLRYALSRVSDRQTAEDLVQETLVAAVTQAGELVRHGSLRAWLLGILRHKILDHYRWRRRHPGDLPAALSEDEGRSDEDWFTRLGTWRADPNAGLEALGGDPAQAAERAELRAVLQLCIDHLSRSLHRVFVLRELEELTPEEVCEAAGISRESLAVLLYRARQSLRGCLQQKWMDA